MSTNMALASIKAAGGTASRTLADRLAAVINVKDYGATGDGITDDRAAIQAAFDGAFGTQASPHANANRFLNKPVYFPAGNYKINGPLYLTAVFGGHIFGAGQLSTRISYNGSLNGNTVVANGITPVIMAEMNYSRLEGLNLAISGANTTCFYLFGNTASCNANTFSDLLIEGATAGMLIGYQTIQTAVSECTYQNVTFTDCTAYGLRVVDANSLNHWVFGGSANGCGVGYSCPIGSIPIIYGTGNANNTWDIDVNNAIPMSVIGCRTESLQFAKVDTNWVHFSGCIQDISTATTFVALQSSGVVAIMDACRSKGTAAVISGPSGSKIYLRGSSFVNANVIAAYGGTVAQNI